MVDSVKSVFITGVSQGLGKAVAKAFSDRGYYIYATRRHGAVELPGPGEVVDCDLSDAEAIRKAFANIQRLDVLVNNARLDPSTRQEGEGEASWFDRNIAVSLRGSYLCALEAFRIMSAQEPSGGAIVNVSSIRAIMPNDRERIPYGIAKAGQVSLTRSLAAMGGEKGIRVNAVLPGAILTENLVRRAGEKRLKAVNEAIPLGRPGTMEECAETVVFAAEQEYMTGTCLNVSGGLLML